MSRLSRFLEQSQGEYRHMRLGLHRIRELLDKTRHPEKAYASVLIAGTNGKGSTARMVESVLRCAGYRCGLYTSPHLQRFQERILIAGREVNTTVLEAILAEWEGRGFFDAEGRISAGEGEWLTWFETATLLALEAFRRSAVELAVLEVGLGGRMDASNAVEPIVSAITSLGLDHTEVLGKTLAKIAREKAGVLRRWRPIILGEMPSAIRNKLKKLILSEGTFPVLAEKPEGNTGLFSYGAFTELSIPLAGRHQLANAAVAIEILWALAVRGFPWSEAELRKGLASVEHSGRMECKEGSPPLILDGAHNPQALEALVAYLLEAYAGRPITVILGMSKEKDQAAALSILGRLNPTWIFTAFPNARSSPLSRWKDLATKNNIHGHFFQDPGAALKAAQSGASGQGLIVATGSLFLVAALREGLANRKG